MLNANHILYAMDGLCTMLSNVHNTKDKLQSKGYWLIISYLFDTHISHICDYLAECQVIQSSDVITIYTQYLPLVTSTCRQKGLEINQPTHGSLLYQLSQSFSEKLTCIFCICQIINTLHDINDVMSMFHVTLFGLLAYFVSKNYE